ncbi:MAG: Fic family protein [Candidatus Paceibacterota bacterium]
MIKLTERQKKILGFITENTQIGISEILEFINKNELEITRFSIIRDLNILIENNLVKKVGGGRSTKYTPKENDTLHKYIDIDDYFKKPQDERVLISKNFEFNIFEKINNLFTKEQLEKINVLNNKFRENINKISPTIKKLEMERFIIELSWKSSQIEGNTYSLLDTEYLIKNKIEAEGHKKEEAIMILNHKITLDFINKNTSYFKSISIKKIEELHKLITEGLGVNHGIRKSPVGITGTNYIPLDNEYQIKEAIKKMTERINKEVDPIIKAFLSLSIISYIQPFEDGNKRTARLLANAILIAHNYCPLSYRSVKEVDYKKAILVFYESHNLDPLKRMFVEQFEFAIKNYFRK